MLKTMPELLIIEAISALILGSIAVVALVLYLREYKRRIKLVQKLETESFRRVENKSYGILHRAFEEAKKILGKAELEGIGVVAESKVATRRMEDKYGEQLSKEIDKAEKEFATYLEELKTQGEQAQLLSQEFTKQRASEIFEKFEQNLSTFLTSTEQKSTEAIELELKAARQLIDTYKNQQLALIDENIVAMLEKTLSLVLAKKISLKDEVDLVYEALEKAKVEKFII